MSRIVGRGAWLAVAAWLLALAGCAVTIESVKQDEPSPATARGPIPSALAGKQVYIGDPEVKSEASQSVQVPALKDVLVAHLKQTMVARGFKVMDRRESIDRLIAEKGRLAELTAGERSAEASVNIEKPDLFLLCEILISRPVSQDNALGQVVHQTPVRVQINLVQPKEGESLTGAIVVRSSASSLTHQKVDFFDSRGNLVVSRERVRLDQVIRRAIEESTQRLF